MALKKIFIGEHSNLTGLCQINFPNKESAMILHSHPRSGGSCQDSVVRAMYRAFYRINLNILAFNFSCFSFIRENDIAKSYLEKSGRAIEWLQRESSCLNCWIGGYSYGAWIALQLLMRRPEITRFIVVSPPVNFKDFSFLSPCPISGLIITGSKDAIAPPKSVQKMIDDTVKLDNVTIEHQIIEGADHTFKNYSEDIQNHVNNYVRKTHRMLKEKEKYISHSETKKIL